ncbi:MAG: hypothetical protein HYX41_04980 [Bdellovibrio sp.]|nr:hypothetical protein [Bdellovibrio sp.]
MSQPLPLVEQLKNLEQLQEIDLKIDSLKKNQSSLPGTLKQLSDSVKKLKTQLDTKNAALAEIDKTHRQTQAALELNRDRMTRSNQKLESVHNSQEFQAASKEIEQLKKLNGTLDEQGKKSATDREACQKEVEVLTEKVAVAQTDLDSQTQILSGQDQQFNSDIGALTAQRTQFSVNVEARILAQYDRVRGARNGLGIVPAVGGRCKGCNMMLPPQLFNEVQRGTQLHSCPSCHRILFVPNAAGSSAEQASVAK